MRKLQVLQHAHRVQGDRDDDVRRNVRAGEPETDDCDDVRTESEVTAPAATGWCRDCGEERRTDSRFCGHCGSGTPPMQHREFDPGRQADAFASQGQVRQNQTYVGNRLMFTRNGDIEANFANVVSGRMIWAHFKGVVITQIVLWFIGVIIILPLTVIGAANSAFGGDSAAGSAAGFFRIVFFLLAIGLLISSFLGWQQLPMSEWELLLDGRSMQADDAYAAITLALARRTAPVSVEPMRIATDTTRGEYGSYLVVRSAPYGVYVTVLPYGSGLYLAWSMWREQRVTALYAEWFRQLRNRWSGGGTLLHLLLRAQTARALRETVHNAVRDGVEAALERQRVPLADAFGSAVPPVQPRRARSTQQVPPRPPVPRPHAGSR